MLPVPRAAIPGANAATTANGARTLTASKPSNPARLGRAVATRDRVTTALKSYVGAGRRLADAAAVAAIPSCGRARPYYRGPLTR